MSRVGDEMAIAGRSSESKGTKPRRRVALLLVHGMGEQQPHQLTDLFAVQLRRVHQSLGKEVGLLMDGHDPAIGRLTGIGEIGRLTFEQRPIAHGDVHEHLGILLDA